MARYFRAADLLNSNTIAAVMDEVVDIHPDWAGGLIYFPSVEPTTGHLSKAQRGVMRAQAVVFTEDGFSLREVAAMLNVSTTTIKNWRAKYGDEVRAVLSEIREEKNDG